MNCWEYEKKTKEELENEYKEDCRNLEFFNRNPLSFEKWLDLYCYKLEEVENERNKI